MILRSGSWADHRPLEFLRGGDGTNQCPDMGNKLLFQLIRLFHACLHCDVCVDGLAFHFMGITDHGGFGDLGMCNEGAFHFRRSIL